jgi:hypothetical protein
MATLGVQIQTSPKIINGRYSSPPNKKYKARTLHIYQIPDNWLLLFSNISIRKPYEKGTLKFRPPPPPKKDRWNTSSRHRRRVSRIGGGGGGERPVVDSLGQLAEKSAAQVKVCPKYVRNFFARISTAMAFRIFQNLCSSLDKKFFFFLYKNPFIYA